MSNNEFKKNTSNNNWGVGGAIHTAVEKVKDILDPAVEKMKEWTGMEIIDDPEYIKGRAMKMNPNQADLKNQALHELCENNKVQSPVQMKQEPSERFHVMEKASKLNKDQAELKEQMQHELCENNKEIPAFDSRTTTGVIEKVKGALDTTTHTIADKTREVLDSNLMQDAVGKVKEVWDTTSTSFTEKTGDAVEKMKEWTGMEIIDDPEYIRSRAMKMNPEQAQMKSQVQRELCEQQQELSPIHLKKGQLKEEQRSKKQRMQKELCENNKEYPAFDEKISAVDRVKEAIGTTTTTIAEKTGPAIEKMKEWTGIDTVLELSGFKPETFQNRQQIKDSAVQMNPEQAYKKTKMQKELREQYKPQSPVAMKKQSDDKSIKNQKEEKGKKFNKDEKFSEQQLKERKFQSDKEKKLQEEQLKNIPKQKTMEKTKFDQTKKSGFAGSEKPTTKLA